MVHAQGFVVLLIALMRSEEAEQGVINMRQVHHHEALASAGVFVNKKLRVLSVVPVIETVVRSGVEVIVVVKQSLLK